MVAYKEEVPGFREFLLAADLVPHSEAPQDNSRGAVQQGAVELAVAFVLLPGIHEKTADKQEQKRQQDRQDVSMGVMSAVEYRMKWYNEDEATAKKNLPVQNNVME